MKNNQVNHHPGGENLDVVEENFQPEPPCKHCVAAQRASRDVMALCPVHTLQSRTHQEIYLQSEPQPGDEQQRQNAWILY